MFQSRNVSLWKPRSVTASIVVPMMPSDSLETWMSRSGIHKSSADLDVVLLTRRSGTPIGRAPYCALRDARRPIQAAVAHATHTKSFRIIVISDFCPGKL